MIESVVGGVFATLLLAGTALAAPRHIRLLQITDQCTYLDQGKKGLGQGDAFIDRDVLQTPAHAAVGHSGVYCPVTSVAGEFQCLVTLALDGQGTIILVGMLPPLHGATGQQDHGALTVVGGTVSYRDARGEATVDIASNALLTYDLHLDGPDR